MAEFEHVVPVQNLGEHVRGETVRSHVPKGDDDELGVLSPVFNVIGNNRDVSEVQGSVNFVHEVKRSWLRSPLASVAKNTGKLTLKT
jgi:hypothetical protein